MMKPQCVVAFNVLQLLLFVYHLSRESYVMQVSVFTQQIPVLLTRDGLLFHITGKRAL